MDVVRGPRRPELQRELRRESGQHAVCSMVTDACCRGCRKTEQDALEAGNVWWEGELFSGMPEWRQLLRAARTTADGRGASVPRRARRRALPNARRLAGHARAGRPARRTSGSSSRTKRFFAMIIPKDYGGLGFSPLANSMVLTKICLAQRHGCLDHRRAELAGAGRAPPALRHGRAKAALAAGTRERRGNPLLRSDVAARGLRRDGNRRHRRRLPRRIYEGKETVGISLNWDKRYITLAPIATVLGLAFKLYDPEHLLGEKKSRGITAALVPTDLPGIEIGRRHFPINIPFQNGPTRGKDVFVPLDAIIGGPKMAGEGWRMLVQLLSVGRSIVLPSNALGGAMAAVYASGAYARIRRQFGLPIGKFHGVGEVLARMAGHLYIMAAASRVTCTALTHGEKPAVPSAILKYHNTELGAHDRQRRDGCAWRQSDHARPEELSCSRIRIRADRHYGRRREHSDAESDHLRPGRHPLPSVRARGNGGGQRTPTPSRAW